MWVGVGVGVVVFSLLASLPAEAAAKKKKPKEKSPPATKDEAIRQPAELTAAETWPAAELTVGFTTRDSETEGLGDLLIPIWNPGGKGLLFLNPRTAITDRDAEEANLGLGYRQLLPKHPLILGGNLYYDYRDTRTTHYDQWGVGLELLSPWLDARANYYKPDDKKTEVARQTETLTERSVATSIYWDDPYAEDHYVLQDFVVSRTITTRTTTRVYQQFEQALEGYDWEIGLRLPLPFKTETAEARIFGGYYDFDNDLGAEAKGWKARAELRLAASLYLDAGLYEDDKLTGSDWFAGARLAVPLDLAAIAKGRNPFGPAKARLNREPRDFSARLTEMVMRDPQVRLETSKYIENKALGSEQVTRSKKNDRNPVVLLSDVQFVHGDATGPADGTAERPFPTIQQGADAVYGRQNVYVFNVSGPYQENVVLLPGTTLWGSGLLIPGYGGKSFGSGIQPIVDGMNRGPSITMADGTTVQGFHVRNTDRGLPPIAITPPGIPTMEISRVGVFGNDATDLLIQHNLIQNNSDGIVMYRQGDFNAFLRQNVVQNNDGLGLLSAGLGASGTHLLQVENSRFTGNLFGGAVINVENYDLAQVQLRQCMFSGNLGNGAEVNMVDNLVALATVFGVEANDNAAGSGLLVRQIGDNEVSLLNISDVVANDNLVMGVSVVQYANSFALSLMGMPPGLADPLAPLVGNLLPAEIAPLLEPQGPIVANRNGWHGVLSQQMTFDPDSWVLGAFFDITANQNQGTGVEHELISAQGQAIGLAGSSRNLSELLQLGANVLGPLQLGEWELPTLLATGQLQTHNNDGPGWVMSVQGGNVSVGALVGLDTTENNGSGAMLEIESQGPALAAAAQVNAFDNIGPGLGVISSGSALSLGLIADVNARGNFGPGAIGLVNSEEGSAALLTLATDALRPAANILGQMFLGAPVELPGDPFGPNILADNGGSGLEAFVWARNLALVGVLDTHATGNFLGGFNVDIRSLEGVAAAAFLSSDLLYDVIPDLFGEDPIPYNPLGGIVANDNGQGGIHLDMQSYDITVAILAGIQANGNLNNSDGINLDLASQDGGVRTYLTNLEALGNTRRGINMNLVGANEDVHAGLTFINSSGNEGRGILVNANSAAANVYALVAGVDTFENGAGGLVMNINASLDGMVALSAVHSGANGSRGAGIQITSGQEAYLTVGSGAVEDLDNRTEFGADLGPLFDRIERDSCSFNENNGSGFRAIVTGEDAGLWINEAEASANGNFGFDLALTANGGSALTDLAQMQANLNGDDGIRLALNGAGSLASAGLAHTTTWGNTGNGINVIENFNGSVVIAGKRLTSIGNTANGVRLAMSGLTTSVLDFGGGLQGSVGQSSIFNNGNRDFRYNNGGGATVKAENNWWGQSPPANSQFAGNIDRTPWLTAPPP